MQPSDLILANLHVWANNFFLQVPSIAAAALLLLLAWGLARTAASFPGLPSIGQAMRFTDHRRGDFTVVSVGYVQHDDAFIFAVWLASSDAPLRYFEEKGAQWTREHRDPNYDVPPATITTYWP